MRFTFSIILLLIASHTCFSQKTVEDYYLKRSLKQEGEQLDFRVLEEDKRGVFFYSKKKVYHWYKAQHMIMTQGGSSGELLHGDFESFYSNKQLAKQGDFNRGLKNGEWLYWRENGTLIHTETWKRGIKVGWEKWYDETGEVFQTTKHKFYGSIRENKDSIVELRSDGKIQIVSIKDSKNKVEQINSRKNGKLHGVSKTFENGKLILTQNYKNGELVSEKSTVINMGQENSKKKWWQIFKKKNTDKGSKTNDSDKKKSLGTKLKKETEKDQKEKKSKAKEKSKSKDEPKKTP